MPVIMSSAASDTLLLSDEDYLVLRAKQAFNVDPHSAKAWMLTAKTLYPNNFAVQVSIYSLLPFHCNKLNSFTVHYLRFNFPLFSLKPIILLSQLKM